MLPTLNMTGDIVGFEHLTQRFSKLDTGDLVVAVSPTDPSKLVCKRIIGVPGDKVVIDPVSPHRQYITVSVHCTYCFCSVQVMGVAEQGQETIQDYCTYQVQLFFCLLFF